MQPNATITPSTLSVKDLPWQILWHKDKCTLCGRCTAVCLCEENKERCNGEKKRLTM